MSDLKKYFSVQEMQDEAKRLRAALRKHIEFQAKRIEELEEAVAQQAEDDGLWFIAETAPEAYLQNALRYLHALIEQDTQALQALNGVDDE